MSTATALTWRHLTFPAAFELDHTQVFCRLLAMRPLHGWFSRPDPVVVEVVGKAGQPLRWQVGMTPREAGLLLPQIRGQLADVSVERTERHLPALTRALELRLDSNDRPLRTDTPAALTAALLTAVTGVHGDEALALSWVIGPWQPRPAVQTGQATGWFGHELSADEATALRHKMAEPVLGAIGRIGVAAASPARSVQLMQRVLGALQLARAPGAGFVTRVTSPRRALARMVAHRGPLWRWPCLLNATELACVLGWPIGNPHLPGVSYRSHRQLPAAPGNIVSTTAVQNAPAGRFRVLGEATHPTQRGALVHLPIADALHHLHVVGPTGSGKSVLLGHLIDADIAAGRSVVVIEPRGDLVAAAIDRIPPARVNDVVLLDPNDTDAAVGINVLAASTPELAADRLVHVIRAMWPDSWGPRTAAVLYAAAVTLSRAGQTLAELPLLLTNNAYRQRILQAAPDPLGVGPFWARFDTLSPAQQAEWAGPTLNRLTTFVGRQAVRAVVGQHDARFNIADLFRVRPRVLLVSLARRVVGPESAHLLGALLLSQLWEAAQARTATPEQKRRPVAVYVDEFNYYAHGLPIDFGHVLAQARGLGLALTVAHQALHQLDPATRAGTMTNARSRVVFQTKAADSDTRALAASLGNDIAPADIDALDAWEAYATLVTGHATRPAASLVTRPPAETLGTAPRVQDRSHEQWARPIADIDAAILARHQQPAAPAEVGRVPRKARR